MNLEDLTIIIDLNAPEWRAFLAEELVIIVESECCMDETVAQLLNRLSAGELCFND